MVQMQAGPDFIKTLPGVTGPFGFFDPLQLTPESKDDVLLWREAELQHGRVAMMAAAGFIVQESGFHPFFPDDNGPAAFQLDTIGAPYVVLLLLLPIFQSEITRAKKGWVEPEFTDASYKSTVRTLRADYTPGDLGFDPLGMKPTEPAALLEMQNKELNNGRLAMIAVAGMVAQELVDGKAVFG